MQIYTYPKSRSLRVLWVLEELRISYETIKVDLLEPNPAIKSPHPKGKVPYQIDDNVIY
ncbi:glutathione S-transferase N-terminal domain-containing protein [Klebsiella oxytoca]|uniref:glutathione S-transferase N-terminal domain-containing protein n=1 Tax=Klebsiella TaxID=570 RepID=UPI001CCDBB73|nr:glutathione S-transferase N-terminal domain-containing protein [Klebsiella oxytoca]MDU3023431.1 glutathione S-transferase N-terminal domain-containing protein [Klebsiella oxytoca]MDU3059529.1 glutathione S-transferase N-terminal domain-containing protein [Klebsiella oxytoca]MDU8960549.1 glutathione S-transferase N-terminal domain-containing protein [Klebsiella oxytoca]